MAYIPTTPSTPTFSPSYLGKSAASDYGSQIGGLIGAIYGLITGKRPEDYGLATSDALTALFQLTPLGPAFALQNTVIHGLQFVKDLGAKQHAKSAARKELNRLGYRFNYAISQGHDPGVAIAKALLGAKLDVATQRQLFPITPFIGPVSEHVALPSVVPTRDPRTRVGRSATTEVRAQGFGLVDPETGLPATDAQLLLKYGAEYHARQQREYAIRPAPGYGLVPTFFARTSKGV